jgi:pilus assembly protein CpaF
MGPVEQRPTTADWSRDVISADSPLGQVSKDAVKRNLHYLVIEDLGAEIASGDPADLELRNRIEARVHRHLSSEATPLSALDREEILRDVVDNILGYGPIQRYLEDPEITEVMVNNANTIYIERFGKIYRTESRFLDESHLLRIIDKIVAEVGRRVDESSPMVDARLPDGSRVNAIISPLALNGPMLTVRKFSKDPLTAENLMRFGTLTPMLVDFLKSCVEGKLNVLITGGTGTGKTTLLNVVSQFIPSDERIVTIEDAAELQLHQSHVLRLESRPANIEGRGQVTIRDLVRNSLRMRPDRIVVGEVRGAEALDMLQAMNTGHEGSLSTVHANSPRDAMSRLETMVLMAGFDLPVRAIREQVASALDLVVHLDRLRDGSRRVVEVAEVEGLEGDTIVMQNIFRFDYSMGLDEQGRFRGHVKATGLRPKFTEKLEHSGIRLPAETFALEGGRG